MFESLTEKLQSTFKKLSGQGKLTEKNVSDALREVRFALLEADVSYKIVRQFVDDVVTVTDSEIVGAMEYLLDELKLACEPACATALAGAIGPLRDRLFNKKVCVVLCGSNTDAKTFADYFTLLD